VRNGDAPLFVAFDPSAAVALLVWVLVRTRPQGCQMGQGVLRGLRGCTRHASEDWPLKRYDFVPPAPYFASHPLLGRSLIHSRSRPIFSYVIRISSKMGRISMLKPAIAVNPLIVMSEPLQIFCLLCFT
jgi:hypothetical protein